MVKMRSGSLMVSSGTEMHGIVTERDVLDKLPFGVGASRGIKVTDLMTPKAELVTAPPSFTLDQCVKAMQAGTFRHLPIVEKSEVKAVISMRDIAQHVASALAKAPAAEPTTVRDLMEAKGGPSCLELPSSASVGAAVELMRETRAGSVLISSSCGFGIITERDYLTKVAVYDEANPHDVPVTDIMTTSPYVKVRRSRSPHTPPPCSHFPTPAPRVYRTDRLCVWPHLGLPLAHGGGRLPPPARGGEG